MATHSSVLAWRIPGTEEPGGLLSMWSHRVRHDWSDLAAAAASLLRPVLALDKTNSWKTPPEHFCNSWFWSPYLLICMRERMNSPHQWRMFFCSVQFSHSIVSNSLRPHGLQHARPPCPSPTPRVHPNSCPLSWTHTDTKKRHTTLSQKHNETDTHALRERNVNKKSKAHIHTLR